MVGRVGPKWNPIQSGQILRYVGRMKNESQPDEQGVGKGPGQQPQHILISSIKDEGPFILEWVAHHLVLGFDRICVASNDCSDGSDRLLDALDRAGYISHVANEVQPGEIPQHAGYAAIRRKAGVDAAEWLMMLDADEFLNVHVGGHRVADLTGLAAADIDVIALNGMCFGDAPEVNWHPGPICPRFPHRLPVGHKANFALKTLTRDPARFGGIHNHSMVGYKGSTVLEVLRGDGGRYALELGVPLWKQLRHDATRPVSHEIAQYNHYPIKTWDAFMLRRARGRGAVAEMTEATQRHTDAYFAARSLAAGTDRTILRYGAEVAARMQDMLADQKVRRRQQDCDRLYAALAAPYRR